MPETPKSAYFREMLPYPLEEFRSVLGLNMDSAKKVVSALKRSGVAKAVNRKTFDLDQLTEESEVIEDVAENCVLKCYPKYIDNYSNDPKDESGLVKELRSVLKAIQKHNDKVQSIHLYNGEDYGSFNMLGLVLHILHDYYENGIYTNYQEIIETNGEGEIVGNIVGKLQICDARVLAEKLAECGIEKNNFSAQSYYVIEIEDVRTVPE